MDEAALARARDLEYWRGPVAPEPLGGGLSNRNFTVLDGGRRHVVRIGGDVPAHAVWRFNEVTVSRAAHAAGLSPEVLHHEPGVLVLAYVAGARTYQAADVRAPATMARIVDLVRRCHRELPRHLDVPGPCFWVFQAIRRYLRILKEDGCRLAHRLDEFARLNEALAAAFGPMLPVFCHNDLVAANLLDDGRRLWLIDWEYGGWNDALFDLANLATNNELDDAGEDELLRLYHGTAADQPMRRRFGAMKVASLLREALWSVVSETRLALDVDYVAYSEENLERLAREEARYRVVESP